MSEVNGQILLDGFNNKARGMREMGREGEGFRKRVRERIR